ncbi:hypothetical protein BVG16_21960 [Paenibacillus selenitireducens]|uniref:Spore protein YkvP/CgeB glycosyl transferase-like domain-containing protein n=1 Tax=Paenibacillus selenitireducens TaxID=1324314 RepID=A0A1T2X6G1_9BACL|nr:glycosyltransferase [Paenibacillus selenitireducens]OPA75266.1 hypothetical protein BVG16_21960 [Paenibacillus selenitireducens]
MKNKWKRTTSKTRKTLRFVKKKRSKGMSKKQKSPVMQDQRIQVHPPAEAPVTVEAQPRHILVPVLQHIYVDDKHRRKLMDRKKLRILVVTPFTNTMDMQMEPLITEPLRILVQEVVVLKTYEQVPTVLSQMNPDLLLIICQEEPMSDELLITIQQTSVKTALWNVGDHFVVDSIRHMVPYFDVVFTQNIMNIPIYQHLGCKNAVYLPLTADRTMYSPKITNKPFQSDLLLIGDYYPYRQEHLDTIQQISELKKIFVLGEDWEANERIILIEKDQDLQAYYNGANIIVNWKSIQQQVFEAAACGAFQLVEENPNLSAFMLPGEDVVTFRTPQEMRDQLRLYLDQPELKRKVASKALWRSHYDYSSLHMAMRLLDGMFGI